jgi:hypothetical protein
MPLHGDYIQMSLSPGFPNASPKIATLLVSKLWTLIYFSNKIFLENEKEISYSSQKYLSNDV